MATGLRDSRPGGLVREKGYRWALVAYLWMRLDDGLPSRSMWLFGICPEEFVVVGAWGGLGGELDCGRCGGGGGHLDTL